MKFRSLRMVIDQFIKKIQKRKALIGIIGMGYVGLPLVLRFCEEGFRVLGFDVDSKKWLN
jgi:UDP-N-acetyl-D-glucosamine dehydrogenase